MTPADVVDLHETHAALDEALGFESVGREVARAVAGAGDLGFLDDVEGVGRAICLRKASSKKPMRGSTVFHLARFAGGRRRGAGENELGALLFLRAEHDGEVEQNLSCGSTAAGVGLTRLGRAATGDEAGFVLVLGTEAVEHSRAEGRFDEKVGASVKELRGGAVRGNIGLHGADDA